MSLISGLTAGIGSHVIDPVKPIKIVSGACVSNRTDDNPRYPFGRHFLDKSPLSFGELICHPSQYRNCYNQVPKFIKETLAILEIMAATQGSNKMSKLVKKRTFSIKIIP